ncbi:MAG: oxidoreductase [Planctomycetes bacterium]|nr:oxidoreductase [Planctomycetota bacterium]
MRSSMSHALVRSVRAAAAAAALLGAACQATADGPWCPVPVPAAASLRGLAVTADGAVWVGGAGALWTSRDGGATWRDVRPQDCRDGDFRDLAAWDCRRALAMVAGQPARVYLTEDGGASWRIVLTDPRPAAFFDAVAFAGAVGVLFGDPVDGRACVWRSGDGGATWQPLAPPQLPTPLPGEAGFAASGACATVVEGRPPHAWIVTGGAAARMWNLPWDGGAARAVPLPVVQGQPSQGAFAVAVRGRRAVVVGGDYRRPELGAGSAAWSDDGGATWHAASAGGYRSAVVWLDDERLLAVGSHGASESSDGGRTWRPFAGVGLHALAMAADGAVWACGDAGRVERLPRAAR